MIARSLEEALLNFTEALTLLGVLGEIDMSVPQDMYTEFAGELSKTHYAEASNYPLQPSGAKTLRETFIKYTRGSIPVTLRILDESEDSGRSGI